MKPQLKQLFADYATVMSSQQFDETLLDYSILTQHLDMLRRLNLTQSSAVSVFDNYRQEHVYLSSAFEVQLGLDTDEARLRGKDYFTERIHPDDLAYCMAAGIYFMNATLALAPHERFHYKLVFDYRFRGGNDQYLRVIEQFQLLELDPKGNIWLALCLTDISPDQDLNTPFRNRLINLKTGQWHHFESNLFSPANLSHREREVLQLIAEGLISKQIADKLFISVHTVNTHRQRIIEKMEVSNIYEAVSYAQKLGLL